MESELKEKVCAGVYYLSQDLYRMNEAEVGWLSSLSIQCDVTDLLDFIIQHFKVEL